MIKTTEEANIIEKVKQLSDELSHGKSVDIDFTTMDNKNTNIQISYENGAIILFNKEKYGTESVYTKERFSLPLKVEARAMTSDGNIVLSYNGGFIILSWDDGKKKHLFVRDFVDHNKFETYRNKGEVPKNTMIDIEWFIGKDIMTLKVDGELRVSDNKLPYIEAIKTTSLPPAPLGIQTSRGTTVTVESLRVTEI